MLVFYRYGITIQACVYALLASVLIVIAVVDFRTFTIPFGCNVFIFALGIAQVLNDLPHMSQYVIGFFAISVLLYLIWFISKGRAIGGGDIKLLAASGLLIGWQNIILAFLLGCILGAVIHLIRMKAFGADRKLAFGPYLSAGILIAALYGNELIGMYLSSLGF